MNDREVLANLICLGTDDSCKECCNLQSDKVCVRCETLADCLMSNGVTVKKQGEADIKVLFIGIEQPDCSKEIYTFKFDFEINGNDYHYRHELTSELFEIFGYEKVKHGRWILGHVSPGMLTPGGNRPWVCSECGAVISWRLDEPATNYCPNCGAKMDLEDSDGKT